MIKKLIIQWFLIIVLLGLATGCVKSPEPKHSSQYFPLQPVPNELIGQVWLEKFSFNGVVKRSMLVQTELNKNGLSLVAMTFEGIPLLQSRYHSETDEIESNSTLQMGLDPAQIFHDLQSVYWPQARLKPYLLPNVRLVEQITPHQRRDFYLGEQLIRKIDYHHNQITMVDLVQGYQLDIMRLTTELTASTKSSNDEK